MDNNLQLNYSNIFLTYHRMEDSICDLKIKDHSLVYVYSGEIIIKQDNRTIRIRQGECAFFRHDVRLNMTKSSSKDNQVYQTIVLKFSRQFLLDCYRKMDKNKIPSDAKRSKIGVMKIQPRPEVMGLFESIKPFFNTSIQPEEEWLQMKMTEGLYIVLKSDKNVYASLFDFAEPWKIDLIGFLNQNYMYDLSLEELASYTGRSLTSLKLDFKKISNLPPRKWIIHKRLEVAHDLIVNERRKVKEVIMDVGFKNLSHFSKLYKDVYGHAPTLSM